MDETSSTSSRSTESPPDVAGFFPIETRSIEDEATTSVSMIACKRSKDIPPSPNRVARAKRCLWEVDRDVVDSSVTNELNRLMKEENRVASEKYNFDFEKEIPLQGPYSWEASSEVPGFYKSKEVKSRKRKLSSENEAHSSNIDPDLGSICTPASKRSYLVSSSPSQVSVPTTVIISPSNLSQRHIITDTVSSPPPNKKLRISGKQHVEDSSSYTSTGPSTAPRSSSSSSSTGPNTNKPESSVSLDLESKELSSTSHSKDSATSCKGQTENLSCTSTKPCDIETSSSSSLSIPSSNFYSERSKNKQKCASKSSNIDDSGCSLSSCSENILSTTISAGIISATPVGIQKPTSKRTSPTSTQRSSSSDILSPKYFR